MEPFEIMVSESQERMVCVVEPERVDEVLAVCARWEVNGTVDRRGHRHAAGCACSTDGEVVGDIPVPALVDDCPVYELEPAPPATPLYPAPPRVLRRRARRRRTTLLGAARLRQPRLAPLGVRAVRLARRLAHRAPAGGVRRRRPGDRPGAAGRRDAPRPGIAVSIDGNGRRVACDPYRGAVEAVLECSANLACAGAEPLGPDQLPELRQPGEAAHRLAALARGGRPRPTPAARSASRSSAATSRSTTRAARARSTRRRSSAWSASCRTRGRPAGSASPPTATSSRSSPRASWAPALARVRAGQAARRAARRTRCPPPTSASCTPLHAAVRQGVRSGALRSAHDVAEGGLAVALAECCVASGRGATRRPRAPRGEDGAVRRGPGRVRRLRARARRWRAFGATVRDARRGGRRRPAPRARGRPVELPVAELRRVHAEGLAGACTDAAGSRPPPVPLPFAPRTRAPPEPSCPRRPRRSARRVRRLRRLRARPRRRPAGLLRALRAPAPRAGVGGHRRPPRAAGS